MPTVLVTGATGFVGSHVIEALSARKDVHLVAACRDSSRLLGGFRGEIREGDLRDPAYRHQVLEGVDTVCHAASWSSLWRHAEESRTLYYEPTIALLEQVLTRRISRFVNVSTTAAASPFSSADPRSRGIPRGFWPHLCSVVAIEEFMRSHADRGCAMVNLRLGDFVGRRYGLGLLPILVPRLRTYLVPWVARGETRLPLVDGEDIGQAFARAALVLGLQGYEAFNIAGPEQPTAREVIEFLHAKYGCPLPRFSVSFSVAYAFAALLETIHRIVPGDPLITRSIVLLLEDAQVSNREAEQKLGYKPRIHWTQSLQVQMAEMLLRQKHRMRLHVPLQDVSTSG